MHDLSKKVCMKKRTRNKLYSVLHNPQDKLTILDKQLIIRIEILVDRYYLAKEREKQDIWV